MTRQAASIAALVLAGGCAAETPYDPREDYEEVDAVTIIEAPPPSAGQVAPRDRHLVERGGYLVELLGCGACHTDGALEGAPDYDRRLGGSDTGIAYTSPLDSHRPGVVYPPNITPDEETGIGSWSDRQIADAIRAGIGRHGSRRITTMPWQGYARLTEDDLQAIIAYLRSIAPVQHQVPPPVEPGHRARKPFVYFGVYRSRD